MTSEDKPPRNGDGKPTSEQVSEGEDNGSTEVEGKDDHLHEDQKAQSLPQ